MAFVAGSLHEVWYGAIVTEDKDGVLEYERKFQLRVDNVKDGPDAARLAPGVPRRGALYITDTERNLNARCVSVVAQASPEGFYLREVVCRYSTGFGDPELHDENPIERPAKLTWGSVKEARVPQVDIYGDAYINSAEQPFEPPYEIQDSLLTLHVEVNLSSFDELKIVEFENAVNETHFLGWEPGAVKCESITEKEEWDQRDDGIGSYSAVTVTFVMKYGPAVQLKRYERVGDVANQLVEGRVFLKWQPEYLLDRGTRELVAGAQVEIAPGGVPLSEPTMLDGTGRKLAAGATPVYLAFYPRRYKRFEELDLRL